MAPRKKLQQESSPPATAICDAFLGEPSTKALRGLHVAMSLEQALSAMSRKPTARRSESIAYGPERPSRIETALFERTLTAGGTALTESVDVSFIQRGPGFLTATWTLAYQELSKALLRDVMAEARARLEARFEKESRDTYLFVVAGRKNQAFIHTGPKTGPGWLRMTLGDPEF